MGRAGDQLSLSWQPVGVVLATGLFTTIPRQRKDLSGLTGWLDEQVPGRGQSNDRQVDIFLPM